METPDLNSAGFFFICCNTAAYLGKTHVFCEKTQGDSEERFRLLQKLTKFLILLRYVTDEIFSPHF